MSVWRQIDLRGHAIIEASAGTGKTYAIERLVARLLAERDDLTIDRLLIVTFTEKAAGELKDRVRALLEATLNGQADDVARRRLQAALDGFDGASISTIHAFCQRILREYAFENRQTMELELTDESALFLPAVRRALRESDILSMLEQSQALPDSLDPEALTETVVAALQAYRGPELDSLDEDHPGEITADIAARLPDVRRRLIEAAGGVVAAGSLTGAYLKLQFHAGARNARAPVIAAVEQWLADPESAKPLDAFTLMQAALGQNKYFSNDGFDCLVPDHWSGKGDNIQKVFPAFPAIVAVLKSEVTPLLKLLDMRVFLPYTALLKRAHELVRQVKKSEGRITYDDMIRRVRTALYADTAESAALTEALRKRYRVALVDEFQDTDPLQWDIFRRIFADGADDGDGNRLIIVGDPKQSIYAFRGADVRTYLRAKKHLSDLGAATHTLSDTYRCVPGLVHAFNGIFAGDHWFPSDGEGIIYGGVNYPEDSGRRPLAVNGSLDVPDARPLVGVDLNLPRNGTQARHRMNAFIVAEVRRLLDQRARFRFPDAGGGAARPLEPGDICILVENRNHARAIERGLRDAGVSCTFYKKPGLYRSDEALHLGAMLDFLAGPADERAMRKALVSRFLAVPPETLAAHEGLADHRLRRQLDEWIAFGERRQWGRLLDSLLYDTGLWHREAVCPDGDRRLSNYRQLSDELLESCGEGVSDIGDLAALLRRRREESRDSNAGDDIHRKESAVSKVRIMTMHAAKGLEFPVVFISGGFTDIRHRMGRETFRTYHAAGRDGPDSTEARHLTFDTGNAREEARQDQLEGLKRLYYVALTRAEYRLYLPWMNGKPDKGWNSTTPFADYIRPGIDLLAQVRPDAIHTVPHDCDTGGRPAQTEERAEDPPGRDTGAAALHTEDPPGLVPGVDEVETVAIFSIPSVAGRRLFLDSFTSLARHGAETGGGGATALNVLDSSPARAGDETSFESAGTASDTREFVSLLPRGARSGEAFHGIMEALCHPAPGQPGFETLGELQDIQALFRHDAMMSLVDRTLAAHRIPNRRRLHPESGATLGETRLELAMLAWRALRTSLPLMNTALVEIAPSDRKAEVEFHLAESAGVLGRHDPGHRAGVMNGFMDLVVRHRHVYYILDWKTNTLADYSPAGVKAAMDAADYHLQYQIYTLAAREWLRQSLAEFSDAAFGGAIYIFVRGGADNPDARPGIFAERWSGDLLPVYRRAVLARLFPPREGDGGDNHADGTEDA